MTTTATAPAPAPAPRRAPAAPEPADGASSVASRWGSLFAAPYAIFLAAVFA